MRPRVTVSLVTGALAAVPLTLAGVAVGATGGPAPGPPPAGGRPPAAAPHQGAGAVHGLVPAVRRVTAPRRPQPAAHAPDAVDALRLPEITVAGHGAPAQRIAPHLPPDALRDGAATTMTVALNRLAGRVRITAHRRSYVDLRCARRGGRLVCRWRHADTGFFPVELAVQPGAGLHVGDTATLTVTVAQAGRRYRGHSTVRVGEAVDLAAAPDRSVRAAPGGWFTLPLTVRNAGPVPVAGTVAVVRLPPGVTVSPVHRNCGYAVEEGLARCRFAARLRPGATYTARLAVRNGAHPHWSPARLTWWTRADWAAQESRQLFAVPLAPGSGPALRLRPTCARAAAQVDVGPADNETLIRIRGR